MRLLTGRNAFDGDESRFGFHKGQEVEITEAGLFFGKHGLIAGFGEGEMAGLVNVSIDEPMGEEHIWPFEPCKLTAID